MPFRSTTPQDSQTLHPSDSQPSATARYRLTIAYDGTGFHGWQKQEPATIVGNPALETDDAGRTVVRTVQHVVEQAVRHVVREHVNLQGASRTDAGVHALAQTGAFTCAHDTPRPPDERLALAINARLPGDVLVTRVVRTRGDFEPVTDCVSKGYRYTFDIGEQRPLFDRMRAYHVRYPLDIDRMQGGARALVGTHDFEAFAAASHGRESTVRTIHDCAVTRDGRRVHLDVSGDGFLYNMVRIIAGTLLEVGRGRMDSSDIAHALESRDRAHAGPTLAPHGLCLMWMRYPEDPERPTTEDPA
ncbi:MAG: tRNA pseudouridine synthase A [Planctomycetota bacterium]